MLDRDPAPEGIESRCLYCGKIMIERGAVDDVPEFQGGVKVLIHFCSKECANAYRTLADEHWEEFEEINRAGAT